VKTRIGVIGLDGHAVLGDCKSSKGAEINSILDWAYQAGKSVGIVTSTRITHATPAGAYAHTPDRDWEAYDGKIFREQESSAGCKDIAAQLIDDNSFINVRRGFSIRKL
jgi:alkaline phosphatase